MLDGPHTNLKKAAIINSSGDAVASWLVRSTPGFEPWPGTLRCVLRQDTLLSRCLSPPRCINGYWRI